MHRKNKRAFSKSNKSNISLSNKILRNKKAQITVFIIVGIILLFSSALVFYIKNKVAEGKPPIAPIVERVPLEVAPVKAFVDQCVEEVSKDALLLIGNNGGFIGLGDDVYEYTKTRFSLNEFDSTQSDGLRFAPGSNYYVPYWWYLSSSNRCGERGRPGCLFSSKMPPLTRNKNALNVGGESSIEAQMDRYMNRVLPACLDDRNFVQYFEQQGFTVIQGDVNTQTVISPEEVSILVDYPITLTKDDRKSSVSKFFAKHNINFGDLYLLSQMLILSEVNTSFIETQLMDMIAGYGLHIDEDLLPPIAAAEIDPTADYVFWLREEVADKIKLILNDYVPLFQIFKTKNWRQIETGNAISDSMYFASLPLSLLTNESYDTISVDFKYVPWWDTYVHLSGKGSGGSMIGPETFSDPGPMGIFTFFGLKRYKTYYDLSFPILVTMTDEEAFNGEGFTLRFAIEANIRDNAPLTPGYVNEPLLVPTQSSLLVNENQKQSGEVTVNTIDHYYPDQAVDRAQVVYSCGDVGFVVGATSLDTNTASPTHGQAVVKSKFPIGCAGALVSAEKFGYRSQPVSLPIGYNESMDITIEMESLREINVTLLKKITKPDFCNANLIKPHKWTLDPSPFNLARIEEGFVTFSKIPEYPGEEDYSFIISVNGVEASKPVPVLLYPGKYELDGILMRNDLVIFKGETIVQNNNPATALLTGSGATTIVIPDVEFNETFLEGGIVIAPHTTGYFEITPDDFDNHDEMAVYLIAHPGDCLDTALNHHDLGEIGTHEDLSLTYKDEVMPEFI
ncbi:hypothetical protein ACFL0W_03645 [Nanoarchaeota archaeon]